MHLQVFLLFNAYYCKGQAHFDPSLRFAFSAADFSVHRGQLPQKDEYPT